MNSAVPFPVQALAQTPELDAFCSALERFLDTGEGTELLPGRAAALVAEARALQLPPEHILYALRVARCNLGHGTSTTARHREVGRRYASAIALLLRHYFGVREEDIEPVGDVTLAATPGERAFRAEVAVRMVPDPESGAVWRVQLVREGPARDPDIQPLRRDWLSCESGEERRYISPAPGGWLEWNEGLLLAAIRVAPRDERDEGPR